MGVKTKLSLEQLNSIQDTYQFTKIQETVCGISDSTYFVWCNEKRYVLKLYEQASQSKVEYESSLLSKLSHLKISQVCAQFTYGSKP